MTHTRVHAAALTGITGHIVTVDADVSNGPPAIIVAGLPDTMLREARDRVRAAVINSGEIWPQRRITVSLSPASLPKRGSGSDLAIAIAVLTASGSVPARATAEVMFLAELGLDGQLRPVPGTVPAVLAAAAAGLSTVVVADANAAEAAVVPGVRVLAADRLAAVTGWLRTGDPALIREMPSAADVTAISPLPDGTCPDLADVPGQAQARRALEVCAAGGHHLSLAGPPGSGAVLLAGRLPGIMPRLDQDAALEATSIWSAAGLLAADMELISRPPFIAPHHTSSKAALIGGGASSPRPGAVSLAHHGVLHLDQAPEFSRDVLDALRQPLETGQVTVARHGLTITLPAQFMLILTARPCACTAAPPAGCACSATARRRYLGRLAGPLLDRIDIKAAVHPSPADVRGLAGPGESSASVAVRVLAARDRAARRLAGTPWRVNARVPASELRRDWAPPSEALLVVERAVDLGQISDRGAAKVIRVAWTLADLAGKDRPGRDDCQDALRLWLGVAQ